MAGKSDEQAARPVGAKATAGHSRGVLIEVTDAAGKGVLKRHPALAAAIDLYNGMIRHHEEGAFPPSLTAAIAREHLEAHLATLGARDQANERRRTAVAQDVEVSEDLDDPLKRLEMIVDGTYEHGDAGRGSFFPATADRPRSERMAAMVKGLETVGLDLPADLPLALLRQLAQRAATDEAARKQAEKEHKTKSAAGLNLLELTRAIQVRLGKIVRGRHGRYSARLADYGLKLPKKPTGRRRKKKVPGGTGTA